jgi:hypothetical protein
LTLVKRGNSKSRISFLSKATVIEIQAAKVLQDILQRISGASIPIDPDSTKQQEGEILIGNVNRPELKDVPKKSLMKTDYSLGIMSKSLVITGGTGKGIPVRCLYFP